MIAAPHPLPENYAMSAIEQEALDNAFQLWKEERMPSDEKDDAFEIFTIEQVLKDADLSDEDIAEGNCGGGDDGGLDGFYFFINKNLFKDASELEAATEAELVLIQSTLSPTFSEKKLVKLSEFCRYVFDWGDLTGKQLSQDTKDSILRFRDAYRAMLHRPHIFKVRIVYASRSLHPINANLLVKVEEIKGYIRSKVSSAVVDFEAWGCARLLHAVRSFPDKSLKLEKIQHFSTTDTSVVCLARLNKFVEFLTDKEGKMQFWILEPNVRDYQGKNTVNKQIRETLNDAAWTEDFWWLNNGITILADKCDVAGDWVNITNPQIVNGLQTSHEVFQAVPNLKGNNETRCILVKVIVAPEEKSKNAIIRATNSQTEVSAVSLNATVPLHSDIEDKLAISGLFYDRKHGKYKRLRKPIKKIVSIKALAQAIMASFLQWPAEARARPTTPLGKEQVIKQIFDENYGLDFFAACILLDRQCAEFVRSRTDLARNWKTDLRFYVTMLVACEITQSGKPTAKDLAGSLPVVKNPIDPKILQGCLKKAISVYKKFGATDEAAKGTQMQPSLLRYVKKRFNKGKKPVVS